MTVWEAIIFGIVQGLTEFLPISSTAHIIITQMVLGYQFPGLAFEVFLHFASVLAIIFYFREDLIRIISDSIRFILRRDPKHRSSFWFALYLLAATFITGVLGLLLNNVITDAMKTPAFIAIALTVTGVLIIITERFKTYGNRGEAELGWMDAIIIGLCQTIAVMPGISRSGATLIPALWLGIERKTAVRFSFLLIVPVILGSSVLAISEIRHDMWGEIGIAALLISFVATLLFSWIGIKWVIHFLNRSKLVYFAIYCFVLALCVYLFIDPETVMDVD